ncbi:hypothetical protein CPB84DRAFT_1958918 [Gymnopilus junonius]|uniref:Uncharacterized protein n=1 Tax=Gymnopilus junonius TaxID=109634 RepID=A0A9P5TRS9_GYMJU|nr:hypothetical protein CPB84DRAFT_1958918 [Gymnopilus junonius]
MDKLRNLAEARRATIANASKRATEAEETVKKHQSALSQKEDMVKDLQKRIELTRQCNLIMKDLTRTLSKLDEAKGKLLIVTEKAERLDSKLQSIHEATDLCESKYQVSRKNYNDLVLELENLGIS